MKTHDDKIGIIEAALRFAYGKRREHPVKPEWERRVMSHVLYIDATPFRNSIWNTPAIWRTAAAISMSALVILAYSLVTNIGPEYEAARMVLDDPMGILYTQLLFP